MKTEIDYLIVLNAIPGIGNATARKLLDFYGSARKCLELTEQELIRSGCVSQKTAQSLTAFPVDMFFKEEQALIKRYQVNVISFKDTAYPERLRQIPDAPLILYVKGELKEDTRTSIAIVGSRRASIYGLSTARHLATRLTDYGIRVVSGMARGIDTAAHQGAVTAKADNVAVLGNGLAHIYPPENKNLFAEITRCGAVISEFPMNTLPKPYNFPRRNRIISGLSDGVIVVEAAEKSGALITADFALEQGREVYAVPGNINALTSKGVNHLIKQGAKLITGIDDLLEDLQNPVLKRSVNEARPLKPREHSLPPMSEAEQAVYQRLTRGPVHIDDLMEVSKNSMPGMTAALLTLEMKKIIKQLPGKIFTRV